MESAGLSVKEIADYRAVAIGLAVGLIGGLVMTRIAGLLFAIEPTDPPTYGLVSALLAAVATASLGRASRAAAIDPMLARRTD